MYSISEGFWDYLPENHKKSPDLNIGAFVSNLVFTSALVRRSTAYGVAEENCVRK